MQVTLVFVESHDNIHYNDDLNHCYGKVSTRRYVETTGSKYMRPNTNKTLPHLQHVVSPYQVQHIINMAPAQIYCAATCEYDISGKEIRSYRYDYHC